MLVALSGLGLACIASAAPSSLRIATFNSSLNDNQGRLVARLEGEDRTASDTAAILQRIRPDIVLINEIDHDSAHRAADLLQQRYLGVAQADDPPIEYPYRFLAPVNTGEPSGLDINGDGRSDGPNDCWGFGRHPGQFGMLLLSRFPLDRRAARTFRTLRWSALPDALRPRHPDGRPFHPDPVWQALRLPSKSHWDVPVITPHGTLHVLAAHPTPPVFDGPEDLNGRRNFDEIGLWKRYLDGGPLDWLCDDRGGCGGLPAGAAFVLVGDFNADPADGESLDGAIQQLTEHPRVLRYPPPRSAGGLAAKAGDRGPSKRTDRATHTARFTSRTGNMRVDYVLPSVDWEVVDSGVFWPTDDSPESAWLGSSDHRLVWVDIRPAAPRD